MLINTKELLIYSCKCYMNMIDVKINEVNRVLDYEYLYKL